MSTQFKLAEVLKLDRKSFDSLSSENKELLNYFKEHGSSFGIEVDVVSKVSKLGKEHLSTDAIDVLYPKEVRVNLTDEMTQFLPFTNSAWQALSHNLNKALTEGTKGQYRQKASWLRSQIAKSLPYTKEGFNENTLVSFLKKQEKGSHQFNVQPDVTRFMNSVDIDQLSWFDLFQLPSVNKKELKEIMLKAVQTCSLLEYKNQTHNGGLVTISVTGAGDYQTYQDENTALIDAFELIDAYSLPYLYTMEANSNSATEPEVALTEDVLRLLGIDKEVYSTNDIRRAVVSGYGTLEQVGYVIKKNTPKHSLFANDEFCSPKGDKPVSPNHEEPSVSLLNEFILYSTYGIKNILEENAEKIAVGIRRIVNDESSLGGDLYQEVSLLDGNLQESFNDLSNSLEKKIACGDYEIRNELMCWANSFQNIELLNEVAQNYLTDAEKQAPFANQMTIAACYLAREVTHDALMAFVNEIGAECLDEYPSDESTPKVIYAGLQKSGFLDALLTRLKEQAARFHIM
ncbi:hypothetical protein [Vibrio sp. D431a]|uniref:hypothetical protein n=1 Tax=Vibrio sp. D431a TaxID=2837388 RepID=UPI00255352A3|nr:hypothetical protein [Vibrio sp. D431a]MDK9789970.1 hypothetical protein [Vibrio sp. D431a]